MFQTRHTCTYSCIGTSGKKIVQNPHERVLEKINHCRKHSTSTIDHIYVSHVLETKTSTWKINTGSSDHVPIVAVINNGKMERKMKTITRRCTKHFTKDSWWASLSIKNWEYLHEVS